MELWENSIVGRSVLVLFEQAPTLCTHISFYLWDRMTILAQCTFNNYVLDLFNVISIHFVAKALLALIDKYDSIVWGIIGGVNDQNSIVNTCLYRWLGSRKCD